MIKLITVALFASFLSANEVTLPWLESHPKTFARDFYILQYLKQETTSKEQADVALGLVRTMNNKLFFAYVNKLNHDESTAVVQCMKSDAKSLVHSYADCIATGLTLKKASKLNSLEIDTIIQKIQIPYPKLANTLKVFNAPTVFSRLIASKEDIFFDIYTKTTRSFRSNKLNYRIPKRVLKRISKDRRIERLIKLVITNPKMNLAQKSFFEIDDSKLSASTSFLLAINLISHNQESKSIKYLDNAYKKAYFQMDKDKVDFWKYLITKDENYLKALLKSWDINIYTLYARDYFNKVFNEIIYDVKQTNKEPIEEYDITNQFDWIKVIRDTKKVDLEKIKRYETIFTKEETKPHMVFLYKKFNAYQKHYFINPYEDLMQNYNKERQVLINSIARQESQFIPSAISTAYAQGVMQIMPFLSKALSYELGDNYSIYNMFKPKYSIRYANKHLDALEERFKHPLFIAYAYNGGGGFLQSILKNGLFEKGKYEPYLSMERVPYYETREYGKKVLTNYIIYMNKLNGKNLKTTTLLKRLKKPSTH